MMIIIFVSNCFPGMLTVSDFIRILQHFYESKVRAFL